MKLNKEAAIGCLETYAKAQGLKEKTIKTYHRRLTHFFIFLVKIEKEDLRDVCREDLVKYAKHLREKSEYAPNTQTSLFNIVRKMFRALYIYEKLLVNPGESVELKYKKQKDKIKALSREEINLFLDSIDLGQVLGLRDRAMFELIYSSGLRVSEVANLKIRDVNLKTRLLLIRDSKFGKDRYVPITESAKRFLKRYLKGRMKKGEEAVFLGGRGGLKQCGIRQRLKFLCRKVNLDFSCHSIRHSTATHLLQAGANIRYVQELLGHESMETTVKYTKPPEENLRRIYKQYHPRENGIYREVDEEYLNRIDELKKAISFLSFEEARRYARSLKLESVREWRGYCKEKKPANLPSFPNEVYEKKGWINWKDWLGND